MREVLPSILSSMVKAGKIFVHLRRRTKQPVETFFRQPCTEDIPAEVLVLIPGEGLNRDGIREKAKAKHLYSRAETDLAIAQLFDRGAIDEREAQPVGGGRPKKLFFVK